MEIHKNGNASNPWKQYVYHPHYVDAIAMRRYDENTDGQNEEEHYYLQDANFNVTAVTDHTGVVKERYAYTPYGEVTVLGDVYAAVSGNVSAISNDLLYTGRRRDPKTGLQLNRNRFYASHLGRWLNRDPLEYDGGDMNLYGYVNGMPTFYGDPLGLSSKGPDYWLERLQQMYGWKIRKMDDLWRLTMLQMLIVDPEGDLLWDCDDDIEDVIEAFYEFFSDGVANHGTGIVFVFDDDGSCVSHFFGGAAWEGACELGDTAQDVWELYSTSLEGDRYSDTAYAYSGADFSDAFDLWNITECECRNMVKKFAYGEIAFSDLFGNTPAANTKEGVDVWRKAFRKRLKELLRGMK